MRPTLLPLAARTLLACACIVAIAAANAAAKDCGGAIPCACGDRVVAATTLSGDLNGCPGNGLTIAAGTLDCDGRQIAGPGDRTSSVGVLIRGFTGAGATGAEVRNCRVRNFGRGVEIDGGAENVLANNVLFSNEVGVWVGDASSDNRIEDNHVRDNRDEGIHLGSGTSGNDVARNVLHTNRGEHVYLLSSHANLIRDNVLDNSKEAAIFIKNSDDNVFLGNDVRDRNVLLRGDANGNLFEDNLLGSGYFNLSALEEDGVWGYPHDNHVAGGGIAKASTCFEFNGAYDNGATEVLVDTCRTMEEKAAGGLVPSGNVVSVVRSDGDTAGRGGARRTGRVRFDRRGQPRDKLKLEMRGILPGTPLAPAAEGASCSLADFQGTIFSFSLAPGTLEPYREGVRYVDRQGVPNGLRRFELRPAADGSWRLRMVAQGDFSSADFPVMTFACTIGDDEIAFADFWTERPLGWNLRVSP